MYKPSLYIKNIKSRSFARFIIGLLNRSLKYARYGVIRCYARLRGATIGQNTIITWKLAHRANSNLVIGDDVVIETDDLDLRSKIIVKNNVIINKNVTIIRVSHYIDNDTLYRARYYPDLVINSYSWLATGCKVLPSVLCIEEGAICSAYSVITKDCERMGVYAGNPALLIKHHNTIFYDLVVPSLKAGDLLYYIKARFQKG